jgi:CrcB protein
MRRAEDRRTAPAAQLGDQGVARRPRSRLRRITPPDVLAAVAAGALLGAPARYGVGRLLTAGPGAFPRATFAVNVAGAFALGFVMVLVLERFPPSRYLRPFLATGGLGAFTTYSTFAVETDLLVRDGHVGMAAAYVAATVVAGFVAARAGILAGRGVTRGRRSRP